MSIENIVEKIVSMPRDLARANKSAARLLQESGYLKSPAGITIEALVEALEKSPHYIEEWLTWSNNKRVSAGWYFQLSGSGNYIVGYFSGTERPPPSTYVSAQTAAANFIKCEIEDIRRSMSLQLRA